MDKHIAKIKEIGLVKLNRGGTHYLFDHLGMQFSAIGDDWVEMTMPVTNKVLQPMKILHGGVSFLLCETIGSVLSYCLIDGNTEYVVGTELSGSHLRPCKEGDAVTTRAYLIQKGKKLHRWRFEIFDQNGKQVFMGAMTTMVQSLET